MRNLVEQKRALVNEAKQAPCADCRLCYPVYVMDFDHVRGEKRGNISKMMTNSYSVQSLLAEMAKCDVVCANCHRIRTRRRADRGGAS